MARFAHGLVLGKFYPPHAGHLHLVRTAAARCDRLTLLVLAAEWEWLPLDLRVSWLRESLADVPNVTIGAGYDNTPVDYDDPAIWDAHCAVFARALADATAQAGLPPEASRVDAVFTSEAYGDELARRFEAAHVQVDPQRTTFPVSGTLCRENLAAAWPYMLPGARSYFARRVVIVGAESTGTTTLTRALCEHYRARGGVWAETQWVPEYGRDYTYVKLDRAREANPQADMDDLVWTSADFEAIAREQIADEERRVRAGSPLLLCDTDALATAVWHERYLGGRAEAVEAIAATSRHDLYLLTDHVDVPFEQDGIRDGEHLRAWMTGRFEEVLSEGGFPFQVLTGPHEKRLAEAIAAIDGLLASPRLA